MPTCVYVVHMHVRVMDVTVRVLVGCGVRASSRVNIVKMSNPIRQVHIAACGKQ